MRSPKNQKISLSKLLLLVVAALTVASTGCSDPDKNGGNPLLLSAPTVIGVQPLNGSVGSCTDSIITATFSKAMNPASINASTFTLAGPSSASVAGQVSYDSPSKTAIFTPAATLAANTLYTATITTGVRDVYGNALASNYVWSFTTGFKTCLGSTNPTVISVTPSDGACPNTPVTGTFSEAMNPATINTNIFTLAGASSVAGTVSYDAASMIATFTPTTTLALSTVYTATITTGAKDLSGNSLAANVTWSFTTSAVACSSPVMLNSAGNFVVLAGSTVTNTGPTVISLGDLGLSPGSAVTGFPPGTMTPPAVMHVTDPIAAQAQLDLTAAYNEAAGVQGAAVLPGDLSGLTFTPGVYKNSSTVMLSSGNVTLDGQGDANAVFIFQIGSTLTTLGSTQVVLSGSAQAKNVYWQVGSSATLGTNSIFEGNILALQSITLDTGATLTGRALARNGAVSLDSNTITAP